eukprot:6206704-Pleurochrysis_carterae.AAC.1
MPHASWLRSFFTLSLVRSHTPALIPAFPPTLALTFATPPHAFFPHAGKCGSGKGADAFTSGFEGPWTTRPTHWDNEYFQLLVNHEWEVHKGPGGRHQWRVRNGSQPLAPGPAGGTQPTMMMTSDIALTMDPTGSYQKIIHEFAAKPEIFDRQFAHAWYKLTTRDVGPVTRCVRAPYGKGYYQHLLLWFSFSDNLLPISSLRVKVARLLHCMQQKAGLVPQFLGCGRSVPSGFSLDLVRFSA